MGVLMIGVGDVVVAVRPGGRDREGLPRQRPEPGKTYRITAIYEMKYGLGCCLAGMDPFPYLGYLLFVKPHNSFGARSGWYFKKVQKADDAFTARIKALRPVKENA